MTVDCDGKPLSGSPFVAKAFNTSVIQLTGMPSVGVVGCPVEFTGYRYAAFTPDTYSPDTSCIHLYPRVQHCLDVGLSVDMKTDESCSSGILVSGYMTLYLV